MQIMLSIIYHMDIDREAHFCVYSCRKAQKISPYWNIQQMKMKNKTVTKCKKRISSVAGETVQIDWKCGMPMNA